MTVELQLAPSVPDQRFTTTLVGVTFAMRVRWNSRDESWYLSIYDLLGNRIRVGIRLMLGTFLRSNARADFPAGSFRMVDTSGQKLDARFDDLGTRVKLKFTSHREVRTLRADAGLE